MAESASDTKQPEQAKPTLAELLAKYHSILDNDERGKFFWANPELKQVLSTSNHS